MWGALGILKLLSSVVASTLVIPLLVRGGPGNLMAALLVLLVYNGHDGVLAFMMGRKGYGLIGN